VTTQAVGRWRLGSHWLPKPEARLRLTLYALIAVGILLFRVPLSQIRILDGSSITDVVRAGVAGVFLMVGLAAVLRFLALREPFYLVLGLAVISSGVIQVVHALALVPELRVALGVGFDPGELWLRYSSTLALALIALIPPGRISGPRSIATAVVMSTAITIGLLGAVPLISGLPAAGLDGILGTAVSFSLAAALAVQLAGRLWATKRLSNVLAAMLAGMLSGQLFLQGAPGMNAGSYLGATDLVMLAAGIALLVGGLLELFTDFSSLRIAGARLEDRNRMLERALSVRSQFLSTVSHELMTPLNVVLGFGQLLEADRTLTARQRDQVSRICAGGKRLQRTLSEAVAFADLSSGDGSLRPGGRVEVRQAVLDAVARDSLQDNLQDKLGIAGRVVLDMPDDLAVDADGAALSTILANLLDNAARFSPAGSPINVVVGTTRDATTISVADQGTGISATNQKRIFEPFTQLSSGPTRSHEGVGLGLPISRMLAELMGGSLEVASEPGKGSTFLVRLPGAVVLDGGGDPVATTTRRRGGTRGLRSAAQGPRTDRF